MYRCRMKAYEGNLPYLFISYSHADSDLVLPILDELADRGYRIWYDDGIAPGSEWPEYIATHLTECALVLAFVSPNSVASANCRREVNFALAEEKSFVGIYLCETQMSPGMKLQFSSQQCLMKYDMSDDAFYRKLCEMPEIAPCRNTAAASAAAAGTVSTTAVHNVEKSAKARIPEAKKPRKKNLLLPILIVAAILIAVPVIIFAVLPKLNAGSASTPEPPALDEGWYEVLDEDGETAGYLYSTGKKLTVYDENGEELMSEARFVWDEDDEAFFIDDTAAFELDADQKDIAFTVLRNSPIGIEKGDYTLGIIDEEDVPEATDEEPAEEPAETTVEDPAEQPAETTVEDPAEQPAEQETPASEEFPELKNGYYASYCDGVFSRYFVYYRGVVTTYDGAGQQLDEFEFIYNEKLGTYTDDIGETYTLSYDEDGNQCLISPYSNLTLYVIDPEDISQAQQQAEAARSDVTDEVLTTGKPIVFVTCADGSAVSLTIPKQFSYDTENELNASDGNVFSSTYIGYDESGENTIGIHIELSPTLNSTSDDLYNLVNNFYENDSSNNTDSLLRWTYPSAYSCNGIDYTFCFFDTLINGEYHSECLLVADDGVHFLSVILHYWTYTGSLYESCVDDVIEPILKTIFLS